MGQGFGALAGGLMNGIAEGRQEAVKNQYQKALVDYSKMQTKNLEQTIDLHNKARTYVDQHPELLPVLLGLEKARDPMDQALIPLISGALSGGQTPQVAPMGAPKPALPGPGAPLNVNNQQYGLLSDYWAQWYGNDPQMQRRMIAVESGWNPNAVSPKGAAGLMQLMPGTARDMDVQNPRDPNENIRGGAAYLAQQRAAFGDNPQLALAAYNAGPGAVAKYGGVPPYPETQAYVKKIAGGQSLPQQIAQGQIMPAQMQRQAPQQGGGLQLDPKAFVEGYLEKKYGYPKSEYTWRSVAGPGGRPFSVPFDKRTNQGMWNMAVPDAVEGVPVDVKNEDGSTTRILVDKYNGQPMQLPSAMPQQPQLPQTPPALPGASPGLGPAPPTLGGTGQQAKPPQFGGIQTEPPGTTLTDDAITTEALVHLRNGTLPAGGMSKEAAQAKIKIINKMADLLVKEGITPEQMAMNQGEFKGLQGELSKLQAMRGQVLAFEETARSNLDIVEGMTDKVGNTGVPIWNELKNKGKRSITGDPALAAYDAAVQVAINEVAKVTSGATGGAVTSDSARKEIEGMLNSAQSPAQVKAVLKTLRSDMANRVKGFEEQIASTQGQMMQRMVGEKKAGAAQPKAPSPDNDPLGLRR